MKSFSLTALVIFLLVGCVPVKYVNYSNNAQASSYENAGKLDSAIYFYTLAIAAEPKNPEIYRKRALVYNKMNKFREATADIEQAISMSKKTWGFYYSRAAILEKQGLYERAIPDYSIFIDKSDKKVSDYYLGYWGRGKCYYYTKRYNEAAADFTQSIKFKADDIYLFTWRGAAYYDDKKFAEAAKDYETYLQKYPNSYREIFYLGTCYVQTNRKEKAMEMYNKMADQDPSIRVYFKDQHQLDLFNLEYRKEKVKQALEEANLNLEEAKNSGSASMKEIKLTAAFENLETGWGFGSSMDKDNKMLLDSVGQKIQALYPLLKTKPAVPEYVRKFTVQAGSFVEEKNYQRAIELYQQALGISPYYPLAHFNLAMLYATTKDFRRAIAQMNSYIKLAPDAPDIRAAQDKIYEWELKVKD